MPAVPVSRNVCWLTGGSTINRSSVSIIIAAVIIAAAILAAPQLASIAPPERVPPQPVVQDAASQKASVSSDAEYVFVAQTRGVDDALDDHILALMLRNGIHAKIGGEFIYGVSVPFAEKNKAIALLAIDADQKGYWINFDTRFP